METAIRRFIAEHETVELTRRELSLGLALTGTSVGLAVRRLSPGRGNETLYLNDPDGLSVQTSGAT